MSDDIILKVENLSKQYRLGLVGTGSLGHDLNRFWHRIRGKEDPYLKIGAVNDRSAKASSDYVWALQDINFEVNRTIGQRSTDAGQMLVFSPIRRPKPGAVLKIARYRALQ